MTNRLLLSPLLTAEQCAARVTESDLQQTEGFAPRRRLERLTWRAMLYEALGEQVEIVYDGGAPRIVGSALHIGVSHTSDMVALTFSTDPCAVDVERADRDVTRISERFLTVREKSLVVEKWQSVALWCARECYYKYWRDSKLDLLHDIEVTALDVVGGTITAADNRGRGLVMRLKRTAEHIVVYVM